VDGGPIIERPIEGHEPCFETPDEAGARAGTERIIAPLAQCSEGMAVVTAGLIQLVCHGRKQACAEAD